MITKMKMNIREALDNAVYYVLLVDLDFISVERIFGILKGRNMKMTVVCILALYRSEETKTCFILKWNVYNLLASLRDDNWDEDRNYIVCDIKQGKL